MAELLAVPKPTIIASAIAAKNNLIGTLEKTFIIIGYTTNSCIAKPINIAKKYLEISINLSTYYEYKDNIDKLIKDGYLFSIVIDDTFNGDITELYLFSSIFIYKNSEFFDMIIDSKERIPARIVIL